MPTIVNEDYTWLWKVQELILQDRPVPFMHQPETFKIAHQNLLGEYGVTGLKDSLKLLLGKDNSIDESIKTLEKIWSSLQGDINSVINPGFITAVGQVMNSKISNQSNMRQYYMTIFMQVFQSLCNNAKLLTSQSNDQLQQHLFLLIEYLNGFNAMMMIEDKNSEKYKSSVLKHSSQYAGTKLKQINAKTVSYEIIQPVFVSSCAELVTVNTELVKENAKEVDELKQLVASKDMTITIQNQKISELKGTISAQQRTIGAQNGTITELQGTIDVLKDSLIQLSEEHQATLKGAQDAEQEAQKVRQECADIKRVAERALNQNAKLKEVVVSLKTPQRNMSPSQQ